MKKEYLLYGFLMVTPFFQGLYFEYSFCFANIFLLCLLGFSIYKNKKIYYPKNLVTMGLGMIVFSYVAIYPFVIDKGMHWYGVMKVLEPLLFYLVLVQIKDNGKNLYKSIAMSSVIMTCLTIFLILINQQFDLLIQNNRVGSFFEYANTYGIYLVIGFILLQELQLNRIQMLMSSIILCIGITLTYSRAVYILFVISFIYCWLRQTTENKRLLILSLILAFGSYFMLVNVSEGITINERVGNINQTSEIYSRLLYYLDAVNIILSNIMGLGYDGYFHMQGLYQTGIYRVRLVHNTILQTTLEIGILGFVAYCIIIIGYIKSIFVNKKLKTVRFEIFAFIILIIHAMIDFDFTFLAITNVAIIFLYLAGDIKNLGEYRVGAKEFAVISLICIINIILGLSSLFYYNEKYEYALTVYPNNTEALRELAFLEKQNGNIEEAIVKINQVKGLNNNDIENMRNERDLYIDEKDWKKASKVQETIMELDPMNIEEVEKYSQLLLEIIRNEVYNKECYKNKILSIENMIELRKNKVSSLAYKLKRVPMLYMTRQLLEDKIEAKKY